MSSSTKKIAIVATIAVIICILSLLYTNFSNNYIDLVQVKLERVVDGDTLNVEKSGQTYKVRLIGVDCPESVNPDTSKNTQAGQDASDYTKSLLTDGQTLWLEQDKETTDQYDRTLAYVWLTDTQDRSITSIAENSLQGKLLTSGNANVKTYYPNNKYEDQLKQIEETR